MDQQSLNTNVNINPAPVNPVIPHAPGPKKPLNKTLLFGGIAVVAVAIILAGLLSPVKRPVTTTEQGKEKPTISQEVAVPTTQPSVQLTPPSQTSQSAEMQKAIDEAKQSAAEYDEMQADILASYPWIRKLPLVSEKYYVYFDIHKKSFVGRLFVQPSDNLDQLKAEIRQGLLAKGVEADKYPYEWQTNP